MKHHATTRFWSCYDKLPKSTREVADKSFELLKANPRHPSLHLKKVGRFWSVRVGRRHRALAIQENDALLWVWIGSHAEYDRLLG